MKFKVYKSKEAIALVTNIDDYYHVGEAYLDGGVRPHTFNSKKECYSFLKKAKYRLLNVLENTS